MATKKKKAKKKAGRKKPVSKNKIEDTIDQITNGYVPVCCKSCNVVYAADFLFVIAGATKCPACGFSLADK